MPPPAEPKIYHIVHADRLPSIIADGNLWCDAEIARRQAANPGMGTTIPPPVREDKQAEFLLVEQSFPWELVNQVGVISRQVRERVRAVLPKADHRPRLEILPGWYYWPRGRPC